MTGDMEVRAAATTSIAPVVDRGWADGLMAWAEASIRAHEIAQILCETSFVPKSMQNRPGEVTGAILTGMELGVPIMWALSNIDLIEGVPSIRAKGARALALRRGHEIWTEETTATRAIVCARRKGTSRVEKSIWTLDRAKKAELLGKKNWRLYPTDMLLNRATSEAVRMIGGDDALIALANDNDDDDVDATAPEDKEAPAAPRRRAAQRRPVADTAPPPDLPEPPAAPPSRLAVTCDVTMPHDTRYRPPDGCPPECPTRLAHPVTEAQAVATLEAAGFQVMDVIDTLDAPEAEQEQEQATGPAPQDNPPGDDQGDRVEQGDQGDLPEMMTMPQRKRIGAEMRNAGLTERDERLAFVADVVGRHIETSNELTMQEASAVIKALVERQEAITKGLDRARAAIDRGGNNVDGIE